MPESPLTAQVYAGVSPLTAQLTKCDGAISNPKGLVFWNGGKPSARAVQPKAEGTLCQEKLLNFSFRDTNIRSKAEEEQKVLVCIKNIPKIVKQLLMNLAWIRIQGNPKTLLRWNFKKCEKHKLCKVYFHSQIFTKFELTSSFQTSYLL